MKVLRKIGLSLLTITVIGTLTACEDDDDKPLPSVFNIEECSVLYTTDGYWAKCYDTDPVATLGLGGFNFSHSAEISWGTPVWNGFCPSQSNFSDFDKVPSSDWWQHQWSAITYSQNMLAFWDNQEKLDEIPVSPSCKISRFEDVPFRPESIEVTNSAYAYNVMKKGNDFSSAFDSSSWLKLYVIGVKAGVETGRVTIDLAKGTDILAKWSKFALSSLGEVDYIYFQMESSDTDPQWGMNTPSYFCINNIAYYN